MAYFSFQNITKGKNVLVSGVLRVVNVSVYMYVYLSYSGFIFKWENSEVLMLQCRN